MLKFIIMLARLIFALLSSVLITQSISAAETEYFYLANEPFIRIGLATNARSVSITTTDSQLVAVSPEEQPMYLATNRVAITARAYRPPEIEIYNFELQNIETSEEATNIAKEIREATGEKTSPSLDSATNTWRVRIGDARESIEDADEFKAKLAEKGFEDVAIVTEIITRPSEDAVALSQQLNKGGKSEVRSLIKPTGSSQPTNSDIVNTNLRE